jgi:hypothetical protein
LRPYLEGSGDLPRATAASSLEGWSMVFDGRYKLIMGRWRKGAEKGDTPFDTPTLFDLQDDPEETQNVFDRKPDVVKRLTAQAPPAAPYSAVK